MRGGNMERPDSVTLFERLALLALALGVVQSFLGWRELVRISSPTFVAITQISTFAILIFLILWISRRRSKVALWILVILFVLGLPMLWVSMRSGMLFGSGFITLIQSVLQLVGLALLFTPSARAWFNNEG
jgi:glucan phosphoethanolaminetransferase (alkaline phosphatase superfamily)